MPLDLAPRVEEPKCVACSLQDAEPTDPFAWGAHPYRTSVAHLASVAEVFVRLCALLLVIPPLVSTLRLVAHGVYGVAPFDMVGSILGIVCQWLLFIFPLVRPIDGPRLLAYVLLIFASLASLLIWPLSQPQGIHRWDGTLEGCLGLLSFPFLYLGIKRLAPTPVRPVNPPMAVMV